MYFIMVDTTVEKSLKRIGTKLVLIEPTISPTYGADPNLAEEGKVTPLMIAAYYGQIKTIKDLLKYKANLFARNAHGEQANAYVCSGLGTTHKAKTVSRFLSQYGFE